MACREQCTRLRQIDKLAARVVGIGIALVLLVHPEESLVKMVLGQGKLCANGCDYLG